MQVIQENEIKYLIEKSLKNKTEAFFILKTNMHYCSGSGGSSGLPDEPEIIYGEARVIILRQEKTTGDPECNYEEYAIVPLTKHVIVKQEWWDRLTSPPHPEQTVFYVFTPEKGWATITSQ